MGMDGSEHPLTNWVTTLSGRLQPYQHAILYVIVLLTIVWITSTAVVLPDMFLLNPDNNDASQKSNITPRQGLSPSTSARSTAQPLSSESESFIKSTMSRLEQRIQARRTGHGLYQLRLNQTNRWEKNGGFVYLTHGISDGGLGNWMFMIASLFGIACSSDRIPSLFLSSYWAEDYFEPLTFPRINKTEFLGVSELVINATAAAQTNATVGDDGRAGKFAYWLPDINFAKGSDNVILTGYLQSWRYFAAVRSEVRSLFIFATKIFSFALSAIWSELGNFYRRGRNESWNSKISRRLVGVHVRRGDITEDGGHRKFGHEPAPTEYFVHAVKYFRAKYPGALFFVISNDEEYCKGIFQGDEFLFLEQHHEAVDMAVLSLMDDLILSVGSYGWWASYLSDATETVYYKHWPRKGSDMAKIFETSEYFLPEWIPME
ncbi:putative Galactoside 2-alpha-L-fucosyltransferase 1 [Hypsibius exemplaris]|uniref:L-Fucosyltransferase n=1 Tax=Hypsibius exemplaris TaxID=2072580 RepID=A0A1W0WN97_HYPEX|nr:putative Galactoside 2-alpha-L-fucosyltransferase 1 [Hypsibius exemplaris]